MLICYFTSTKRSLALFLSENFFSDFYNPRHRSDFLEEIQTLSMLEHPNIVKMVGFHKTDHKCKVKIIEISRTISFPVNNNT